MRPFSFFWLTAVLGCFYSPMSQSQARPQILEYLPECDYQVLDTVRIAEKVPMRNGQWSDESKQTATRKIITRLLTKAERLGVDSIIVTNNELLKSSDSQHASRRHTRLRVTAELFNHCDPKATQGSTLTKYGADLARRSEVKLSRSRKVTYALEARQSKEGTVADDAAPKPEDLPDEVSLQHGLYGLMLGSTPAQTRSAFGAPSAELFIDQTYLLRSYGRRHWLLFENQKLVVATTENVWFSEATINRMPFHPVFDNKRWQVEGTFGHKDSIAARANPLKSWTDIQSGFTTARNGAQITLETERQLTPQAFESERIVKGFTLGDPVHLRRQGPVKSDPDTVARFERLFRQREPFVPLSIDPVLEHALGSLDIDGQRVLLFDNHLMATIDNGAVDKIHLTENIFKQPLYPVSEDWRWGEISQQTSWQAAVEILGSEALEMNGELHLYGDGYDQVLLFAERGDDFMVYAMDIKLY